MNIEQLASLDEVLPVLTHCELPVSDITATSPPQFFGIRDADSLVAVIGLEQFPAVGLLRSLAVAPSHRGRGLARVLVSHVEAYAASHGIEFLFLLTTTAETFFLKLGYRPVSREEAPQSIQATSQFSGLCPASSAFLCRRLERTELAVHPNAASPVTGR